jgi:hypothetical protein
VSPTPSPDVFPNYVAVLTDSDAAANRSANMSPTPSLGVFPDSGADLFSDYVADLLTDALSDAAANSLQHRLQHFTDEVAHESHRLLCLAY